MHVCMCVRACVYVHVYMHVCVHACVCACCVCVCICARVHACGCGCVYVCGQVASYSDWVTLICSCRVDSAEDQDTNWDESESHDLAQLCDSQGKYQQPHPLKNYLIWNQVVVFTASFLLQVHIKQGNHLLGARLLCRVANNISKFPSRKLLRSCLYLNFSVNHVL